MRSNAWQDTSQANWIDYLLCWLSSVFAVFSCGQAVNSNMVSLVGIVSVTFGMGLSYLMRTKFSDKWFIRADGVLYCIVAWVAVLSAKSINASVFPEDTFPIELTPSAWLLWMTIFGSFFCWRDGTIIFQAIPALAIFGFVGCYDTFKYVVFFFFLFLICFATLFARAHGRDMQMRAVDSGYFRLGKGYQMNPSEQSTALREGPWRWAAGAEWALGSALIIVVLSLIGAPVVQATAKPLSGIVTVRAPRLRNNNASTQNPNNVPSRSSVGNGPVSLSDTPYFEVSGDVTEYLRVATYNVWSGKSWSVTDPRGMQLVRRSSGIILGPETPSTSERLRFPNKRPDEYWDEYRNQVMKVRSLISTREILQAGNYPSFSCGKPIDNTSPNIGLQIADKYEGTLTYDKVPDLKPQANAPSIIDQWLEANLQTSSPSAQLSTLVEKVTAGLKDDYAKARAIQQEIAKRIKYNIRAEATPEGKDAAEYALFESHEGYCDVFASSMVVMARLAKIPARYTIGYLPDPKNRNDQGTQMVLESDRHAWAELYFEGVGWVPFDATAGAEVVPGGGRKDNKPTDTAAVLKTLGNLLNGLIALAVVVGVVLYIRIRRLPKTPSMIRGDLDLEYVKFIASIWKYTGHRRLLSETTHEYLKRIEGDLGSLREQAHEIGTDFTNLMFGPIEVAQTDVESMRQSVQNFKDLLAKQGKSKPGLLLENAVVQPQDSA